MTNSTSLKHTFLLRNTGDVPLSIERVFACCGTTTAISDKIIPPGDISLLDVTMVLGGNRARIEKNIYVLSNDPTQRYFQVQLKALIFPEIEVTPDVVDFGRMTQDAATEQYIDVQTRSDVTAHVTNVVCTSTQYSVTGETLTNGHSYRIKVAIVPPLSPGSNRGDIRIYTDHPNNPLIKVVAMARLFDDFVVVPRAIRVPPDQGLKPFACSLILRSRTGKPFDILKADAPSPDIKVEFEALPSEGYRIELGNIMPTAELDGKSLVITTDAGSSRPISIPFYMLGAPTNNPEAVRPEP